MGVKGGPQHVRRAGALRKLVMLHLLLVAVCAGAAASPRCAAEDGAAWSSLADSATVLEANVSAAEQQAQLKRQLGGALASAAPAVVRGLVVVIDLSHLTVAIDRCNRGSMRSGAWARHRDKQIVRQTHRLLTAAADAGAIKIEVVLDCGQDKLKNDVAGRESGWRNMAAVAGVRDMIAEFNNSTGSPLATFTAAATSADQVCASLVNDSACSNFSVVLFGYDTDYLYKGIQGEGFIIATIPFGPSPLMAEVRTVQPSAYWAEVGISNPCQQALIAAVAGDDWSEGLNGVGHGTMIAFLSSHPSITSPKQLFESEEFVEGVLGGTYPAQPAVDSVTCSYLRHLYVATATHTTDGWEPLNPLPAGLAVPTSRNATLPQQLHGWDTVVPQPRGMAAGSPEACQHINTLVCDAMDAPFSELPSGNNLKGILRGELHPETLKPLVTPEYLSAAKLPSILDDSYNLYDQALQERATEVDAQAAAVVAAIQQLEAEGDALSMGLSYAAKLLPLLQGSAANTLKAASGVQSWLISNRRHPLVAQAVLNSGWESRSDAAAADYAALTGVLDGMLEEVEVSGDAAAAGQLMGLFRQGSIGGKAAYVLGRSTAAQDALAARVAAQPAHRLQRLSASQIVTLASSIAAVGSQSAQAALLDISRRIGALVQRHGDSTGQHLGWAHPNTKAALEVAHAKQKAAAQAGYSQLLTDLCAAIDALPPAEKVALPLVASGLTVLPASVAAVAHKRPAYMGSTPPAVYFSHARTYSDSFEAALTGKLQSAKQEGQAAAVDLEAVTAAEAAAAAAAARSYAGKKATAAENRRQFRELFEDTLAKLSPASKAALPAHPTMLSDLPDAVTAPLGLEGACDRLGLPRTRPACLGTGTTSLFWSNNMKAKPAVFQEPLYALLHTARQQGAAALTKAAAAPAAQPSGDEDTALAPPAKRARRRPLGDNNNS